MFENAYLGPVYGSFGKLLPLNVKVYHGDLQRALKVVA